MKQVKPADNFSLPIFNTGTAWWNIDVVGGSTFCSVVFSTAHPKHPEYAKYMGDIRTRVEEVANVINEGLKALEGRR